MGKQSTKVNVTFDSDLLERIDAYADENGMTRSGFLAYAAKQFLNSVELMPATKNLMVNMAALFNKAVKGTDEDLQADIASIELAQQSIFGQFNS